MRFVVKFCDKLIAILNTRCYVDSFSQRDFLIRKKVASHEKLVVLGNGSLAGVNLARFTQDNFSIKSKCKIRNMFNISEQTVVILFVGRVTEDKGLYELLTAISYLLADGHDVSLLIVGPFEQQYEYEIRRFAQENCENKAFFTGFSTSPEAFMAVADIFCIPSYREGFSTVVIEAAAMGVPTVGT